MLKHKMIKGGILLGVGLGGFIDGILLHQILQWHNMLSAKYPPITLELMMFNMLWDGIFHLFVFIITLFALGYLWKNRSISNEISAKSIIGSLIIGWGLFNLVEGTINHLILNLHHFREVENHFILDILFITIGGILLMLVGRFMISKNEESFY